MATVTITVRDTESGSVMIESACPDFKDESTEVTMAMVIGANVLELARGFFANDEQLKTLN